MSIKISAPDVESARPDCPDCFGNGYRWDGMVCDCVPRAVNEVIINDDRTVSKQPQPFQDSPRPWIKLPRKGVLSDTQGR